MSVRFGYEASMALIMPMPPNAAPRTLEEKGVKKIFGPDFVLDVVGVFLWRYWERLG